ncbi:uncharacterized protein MYCFIDRAFT_158198 [Pseudocercospora fijiensis CIRAD86]|uniref:Major facilitator superfamily (MFS) profile domain-containing protein n=1 Tax=Pseudocercospora fijiensis (strain CIRAD86) TaxID=383855 RepID=M2ZYX1_PSEFD|nr:uncharacterized protein MYCFIDRAFT_158198 [Pseudocercospora fijiensis CIRAD86]EME77331.1 hypothetical protein MYCFIDRAFT_158198 [Pseudocercospora fijiensis CIRAD86]
MHYDASNPPRFSIWLNILFAFAGAFTVANLYYNHPILNILAHDFGVEYVQVSQIPTLAQAGYAVGLLFLCPLGDMLRRRPFVLSLVFFTATMCIGLAATSSIQVFSAIQFITAVTTVTPQLMMPLVGDLAPPNRRAFALSIVTTGLMLGILVARLLSGVVTQYTSWRTIYWMSVGLQYLIFLLLWCFMPDYPATNPGRLGPKTYVKILWSILVMLTKHPVLVQACVISFFVSATFTNFWTVLTFLLAGPPYHYDAVVIGLFALVGIAGMCLGPFYAKVVIDRFVPLFTVLLGMGWCMLGICLGTYAGTFTVAGPILQAFFQDFGMQTTQIANRSAIYSVEPKGKNRVNTAFMVFTFAGQLTGTAVGAHLYERGGWIASGSYSVGSIGVAILVTLARGPWEEGWVGWHGGWSIWKKSKTSADGKVTEVDTPEAAAQLDDAEKAVHKDLHQHHHGHDSQDQVNSVDAEKSIEMGAAEDVDDRSAKSKEDEISAAR